MDPQLVLQGVQIFGAIIVALLSAMGISKVVEMTLGRRHKKADQRDDIHRTNQGEQLKSDTAFRSDLIKRVDKLEAKIDVLQDEINSQMKENARLSAENEWLKKDNERLGQEIKKLRDDRRQADITIGELRSELNALKLIVDANKSPSINLDEQPIDVRLVDGDGDETK